MNLSTAHWRYSKEAPACTATLKAKPEDFVVTEELGYDFSNDGEHQFIWVEKTLANTAWVAEQLAKFTGLPLRNVSYAGRKDKYAVTRQWIGLHAPGKADFDFSKLAIPGVKVLAQHRHNKKLRTGQLKGNHFAITLRNVSDADKLIAELQRAAVQGVPNYFGDQRFGNVRIGETGERLEGGNLQLAAKMVGGEAIRNRNKRNMAISALRSWLFNEVISTRIENGALNTVLPGDALMLSGSHSFFINDGEDSTVQQRYEQQDLSPTAPLWGKGDLPSKTIAAALELSVTEQFEPITTFLAAEGLKQERRPVKIWPSQLEWQHNGDTVVVSFSLPAGCYATTVLRDCVDLSTVQSAD
ncbi:tRNA pseudouridine(13) synthase TruD [Alteromonas confluentis]|uniref:tRNA pseudouridine synthase D n=1 Tax=Alteromonas confluentis TaxID=1656094 RepID=A0A1E7ZB42_9ALTE|nr:tRNA pseudouridine(13) synthase TruD [Alteromonas confluentis]OFC70720.1 tRNA pseudouridine(13) synthase TruD [Alteromonas confluentis]